MMGHLRPATETCSGQPWMSRLVIGQIGHFELRIDNADIDQGIPRTDWAF